MSLWQVAFVFPVKHACMTPPPCSTPSFTPLVRAAYDADLVVRVVSLDPDSQECNSPIAFAFPGVFETLTRRPTFGEIFFCDIRPEIDFSINLQVVVHELLHVVVRARPALRRKLLRNP